MNISTLWTAIKAFFVEGWLRLKLASPPWIIKLQVLLGGIGTLGAGLALITWPGKLAWVGNLASYLVAFSGGGILFLQFTVKTFGIVLQPGTTISNQSDNPAVIATGTITLRDCPPTTTTTSVAAKPPVS